VTQQQCTAALGRANCIPRCSVLLCKTASQLTCVTAITPTETCSSYRFAVTQQHCTAALGRANCIPHCLVLLYKKSLTAALGHCSYTNRDLLFIQVCSDTTAMHCSTGQGKLDSPLFSAALQENPHSRPGSLQLHLQGIMLDELQAALKLSARGKKPGSDGMPYEFFSQFWEVLGPELLAVLQDAFQAQHGLCLPTSMTQGVITLLYKGKGSKALLDSYRPITLLNSDYKRLAKALATRFGPALQHVVDPTQTAFVPGRWIGDNVLCHLEEVEYLQQTGQPGCMVFFGFQQGI